MAEKKKKVVNKRLVHAYAQMLEHVKTLHQQHPLEHAIKAAKQTMLQLSEYTHEEIELVTKYMTRDFADMSHFLHETEEGLVDWLLFDVELIEERLWESFTSIADKTLLEQQALAFRLQRGPIYKTGEITGIGSLQCDNCGQILHFHKISHIPPCPNCHKNSFARIDQRNQQKSEKK